VSGWQPNARGRLEQAALELYLELGFEETAVADIASRAGLTERTFFRHFADKREVLFSGAADLQELVVHTVAGAPASALSIDAIAAGLEAAGAMLQERPGWGVRATPLDHQCWEHRAARARAHQDGITRLGDGRCLARPRRQKAGRELSR
jgi:AcrR family transcriptional regulator